MVLVTRFVIGLAVMHLLSLLPLAPGYRALLNALQPFHFSVFVGALVVALGNHKPLSLAVLALTLLASNSDLKTIATNLTPLGSGLLIGVWVRSAVPRRKKRDETQA